MRSPYLDELIRYAECFVNTPYKWGGNVARTGLDCSGYINIVLRSVGLVGMREDLRAVDLFHKFSKAPHSECPLYAVTSGCLLFYGVDLATISHVSLVTSPWSVLECGGGGSTTTTLELANLAGAGVRKVSIRHRRDIIACVRPAYPWDSTSL